jgi:hypothetical protein
MKPDIREDLTREHFLFYHYDKEVLIYGGFYGTYDTRVVTWYIKSGTWGIVEDKNFFVEAEIANLERQLEEKRKELT